MRGFQWRLLGAVFLASVGLGARATLPAPPDLILTGDFITLDPATPRAETIAITGQRIVAVGPKAMVLALAGPRTERVAIPGVALPGFADAHAHPSALGEQLEILDLAGLSKGEIIARVAAASRTAPGGEWLRGTGWDQGRWQPPEFPTAAELDAASGTHPALLDRVDGHSVWVNSRALGLAHIARDTPDPKGGRILRDAAGEPAGILVDAAVGLMSRVVPEPTHATRERRLRAALAQYAAWGLTGVHDAGDSLADIGLYKELLAKKALPIRVYAMALGTGDAAEHYLSSGPEIGLGEGRLTVRSFKVLLDGALGSRGAQLSEPYSDAPSERGLELMSDPALATLVSRAAAKDFQVCVHAIGDRANHRLLDIFSTAGDAARRLRFRDEHASIVRDEDVPRFAALGVIASMQPVFVGEYSRWAAERVGPARLHWVYRTRDLLEHGAVVASGTDFPSSDAGDAVATLYSMVTRSGPDGTPAEGWLPDQKVGVDVALRSMTAGPAFASFQENDLGALTVGRYADITVLSADPYAVAPRDLRSLRVLMTWVGGKVVFDAGRR
ncbi:MAG: amidohydrolase [Vicinamibacteria bacterium]